MSDEKIVDFPGDWHPGGTISEEDVARAQESQQQAQQAAMMAQQMKHEEDQKKTMRLSVALQLAPVYPDMDISDVYEKADAYLKYAGLL